MSEIIRHPKGFKAKVDGIVIVPDNTYGISLFKKEYLSKSVDIEGSEFVFVDIDETVYIHIGLVNGVRYREYENTAVVWESHIDKLELEQPA